MRNAWYLLVTKFPAMSTARRGLLLALGAILCVVFLGRLARPNRRQASPPIPEFQQTHNLPSTLPMELQAEADMDRFKDLPEFKNEAARSRAIFENGIGAAMPYGTPLIAHTAELAVATKEFVRSRSSLEEILERHRGYAARLRMVGRRNGSVLSATLRVPATELAATVSELKSLGEVEQEEQAADEVTQQRADLEARLSNAQGTLRRLQELLKKQTYADGNVRELQRQMASANAEVNRLEAERSASEHRIVFANVQFSLREEIARPQESLAAQFHSAAAAGFSEAAASVSALLLLVIGRGPMVLLWVAILYVPGRLIWRKWQSAAVAEAVARV
jgi:hypothetical protein